MDLKWYFIGLALVALSLGILCIRPSDRFLSCLEKLPRHRAGGYLLFGAAAAWFIWNIAQLGKADEVGFLSKQNMLIVFTAIALLTPIYVPDFLAVRGLCILYLLLANELLDLTWMEYSLAQRWFNGGIYIGIVFALVWGAAPYLFRDFVQWIGSKTTHRRFLGIGLVSYGMILVFSTFYALS